MATKLAASFYERHDVVEISRELLGKVLCTRLDGQSTKAIITETEAYAGIEDRASHAFGGRRTARTEPLYRRGGIAYVYLCYGIHHLFNVVTSVEDVPHAVLVRAGSILEGAEVMASRRGMDAADKRLLSGPGSLARALGIRTDYTGDSLEGPRLWIEDHGIDVDGDHIRAGPRIGIDYAGEDAHRPYRFVLGKHGFSG